MKKFHKLFPYLFIVLFLLSGCNPNENGNNDSESTEHILFGYPGTEGTILYRQGYILCHDNEKKVADWVSYHLTDEYLIKRTDRTDDFRPDPELPQGQRSELKDYRGSGYDRGHLAPARDMARSKKTMSESFLLSNMAPQIGPGFNRGIWRVLEEKAREWTEEKKNIYIITGPIYEGDYDTIGPNNVAVPSHFYKIVVACTESKEDLDAIAFILPNQNTPTSQLGTFITTIDEVEDSTGLDFLHELEDSIENDLESLVAGMW